MLVVPVPFVAQPATQTWDDGREEKVYVLHDSAKVVNNRLTTACKPFPGITGFGIFAFLYDNDPLHYYPVVISGTTYQDMDGNIGYLAGVDNPIEGAVIRAPGAENFISYSGDDGGYATYGFTAPDLCRTFPTTAIHPRTMNSVTVSITTCDAPYIVNNLNFRLANKDTVIPDKTNPMIAMNMRIAPGQGPEARFVAGTVPVGTELETPITIIDQAMGMATLTVVFKTPVMTAGQTYGAPLQKTGQVIETYISGTNPVAINKYTYTPAFSFPIAGSVAQYFKPNLPGTYTFTLEATDVAGNKSSRAITIRAVESGTQPEGVDGPPQVDELTPSDGATDIMVTMPVTATFSEPVTNVTEATFTLMDLGPADLATSVTFTPLQVSATVTTMLEEGRVRALLTPANNLMFSRKYKILLTREITDSVQNSEAIRTLGDVVKAPG